MNFTKNRQKEKTGAYGLNPVFPISTSQFTQKCDLLEDISISGKTLQGAPDAKSPCVTIGICHDYRDALGISSLNQEGGSHD